MSSSSIWLIDRTLSGATTPDQSGPGSDGYKEVLHFPKRFTISASPSDGLGHSLQGCSYPFAEMQSMYSTAVANWARYLNDLDLMI